MIVRGLADSELQQDVPDVSLDRLGAQEELLGDAVVRVTFGNQPKDLELARSELVEDGLFPRTADESCDDCRIQDALALVDPPEGIEEHRHI